MQSGGAAVNGFQRVFKDGLRVDRLRQNDSKMCCSLEAINIQEGWFYLKAIRGNLSHNRSVCHNPMSCVSSPRIFFLCKKYECWFARCAAKCCHYWRESCDSLPQYGALGLRYPQSLAARKTTWRTVKDSHGVTTNLAWKREWTQCFQLKAALDTEGLLFYFGRQCFKLQI